MNTALAVRWRTVDWVWVWSMCRLVGVVFEDGLECSCDAWL